MPHQDASPDSAPSSTATSFWPEIATVANLKAGLTFVVAVLTARILGADQYGLLSSAIAVSALFSVFVGLGINDAVYADMRAKPTDSAISLGTCMALRVAAAGLSFCLLIFVANHPDSEIRTVWVVAALSLFLQAPLSAFIWLRAGGHGKTAATVEHASFAIGLLTRIGLIMADVPALWFAAAIGLETTVSALILFYYHGKFAPSDEAFGWDIARAKAWLHSNGATMVPAFFCMALIPLNQALTAWLASPGEAGVYSAAALMYEFAAVLLTAWLIHQLDKPQKSAEGEPLPNPRAATLLSLSKAAWAMTLLGAAAAPWLLLAFFGREYSESSTAFRIFSLALLPLSVGLVRSKSWENTPHETRIWSAAAIGLGANLVAAPVLIPRLGAAGAAIATVLAVFVSQLVTTYVWQDTRDFARAQLRALALTDVWQNLRKPETPIASLPTAPALPPNLDPTFTRRAEEPAAILPLTPASGVRLDTAEKPESTTPSTSQITA